jgi:hypothetical protein
VLVLDAVMRRPTTMVRRISESPTLLRFSLMSRAAAAFSLLRHCQRRASQWGKCQLRQHSDTIEMSAASANFQCSSHWSSVKAAHGERT